MVAAPRMTEVFIVREANVTTLAQMNKIPVSVAQEINEFDRNNADVLANLLSRFYKRWVGINLAPGTKEYDHAWSDVWHVMGPGHGASDNTAKKIVDIIKKFPKKKKELFSIGKGSSDPDDILHLINWIGDNSIYEPKTKVGSDRAVIKFPDGYYWVELRNDEECEDEGGMMQHCGIAGEGEMYSLRDANDKSHVTIDMEKNQIYPIKNQIYQIKGKQNKDPDRKYWKYIEKFIEHFKTSWWPSAGDEVYMTDEFSEFMKSVHNKIHGE